MLRSYRARFLLVHIGDPSSNQATTLESQVIHMIQELFGQTLRGQGLSNEVQVHHRCKRTDRSGFRRRRNDRGITNYLLFDAAALAGGASLRASTLAATIS